MPLIPKEMYQYIVSNMPICTVDLLLKDTQGHYLLGLRTNAPEKGTYFTPGGRVFKNERQSDAIKRIAKDELGITNLEPTDVKLVGVYDHIYADNVWGQKEYGTHCINILYIGNIPANFDIQKVPRDQHSEIRFFNSSELLESNQVSEQVKVSLKDVLAQPLLRE